MDHEDTTPNVYALFPGIDTTPFGPTRSPEPPQVSDEGWSPVPEPTITTAQPLADDDARPTAADQQLRAPDRRAYRASSTTRVLWVGLALLAGAGFAAGTAALTPPPPAIRHTVSSVPSDQATLPPAILSDPRAREARAVRHASRTTVTKHSRPLASSPQRHVRHRAFTPTSTPVSTPASSPSVPQPTQTQPVPTTPVSSTQQTPSAPVSQHTPSGPSSAPTPRRAAAQSQPPAGPTGRIALIGAGTTPSG